MGGKPLFSNLDLILSPGQRIALLGVNGAGKTTLLRLLSGDLQPDSGTIKQAADLKIVTFSQHRGTLVPEETLQEALCPVGDTVDYRGKPVHVSSWAKRFLFEPDQLSTFVGNLSGGEQARVLIANLMLEPADILLLDEPTNDLDIPSLEVLEQALLEFPGALVFVTHDRFMLERIATEYIGLDDSGGARPFMTFQQWIDASAPARNPKTAAPKPKPPRPRTGKQKLSYNQQREYDTMEETILQAETKVEELETAVADPGLAQDHARSAETYQALSLAQEKVKTLYARWAELESLQNGRQ
jgi:ATP-binding cassette subfamily F protein uup